MKHGDFTALARHYHHRPGYAEYVVRTLATAAGAFRHGARVADVGAGTGKLTEQLSRLGLCGDAVEPNDAMRREGERAFGDGTSFIWRKGRAERTGLRPQSVDWVLMGSSFHWADPTLAMREFARILRPGGFFTAIWNPRDIERSALDAKVEAIIRDYVPDLNRVSSGASQEGIEGRLLATRRFHHLMYVEGRHVEVMSRDRYLGVWKSVNDIQVQAGPARFRRILRAIRRELSGTSQVRVTYRTRSWTVQLRPR